MTGREPPPVILPGHGALLPDGRHIPEAAMRRMVDVIANVCEWVENLPPDVRVQLEAAAVMARAEDET